jgi:hypothetical protein
MSKASRLYFHYILIQLHHFGLKVTEQDKTKEKEGVTYGRMPLEPSMTKFILSFFLAQSGTESLSYFFYFNHIYLRQRRLCFYQNVSGLINAKSSERICTK